MATAAETTAATPDSVLQLPAMIATGQNHINMRASRATKPGLMKKLKACLITAISDAVQSGAINNIIQDGEQEIKLEGDKLINYLDKNLTIPSSKSA